MKKPDAVDVQVSFNIRAPKDAKISKKVFDELLQRLIDDKPLPRNVTVRGIFWRNPNRNKPLDKWRWHEGADLTIAPRPIEEFPRGSLQDAIGTLFDGRIPIGIISFSRGA
jgi:hypothetical protein